MIPNLNHDNAFFLDQNHTTGNHSRSLAVPAHMELFLPLNWDSMLKLNLASNSNLNWIAVWIDYNRNSNGRPVPLRFGVGTWTWVLIFRQWHHAYMREFENLVTNENNSGPAQRETAYPTWNSLPNVKLLIQRETPYPTRVPRGLIRKCVGLVGLMGLISHL